MDYCSTIAFDGLGCSNNAFEELTGRTLMVDHIATAAVGIHRIAEVVDHIAEEAGHTLVTVEDIPLVAILDSHLA